MVISITQDWDEEDPGTVISLSPHGQGSIEQVICALCREQRNVGKFMCSATIRTRSVKPLSPRGRLRPNPARLEIVYHMYRLSSPRFKDYTLCR